MKVSLGTCKHVEKRLSLASARELKVGTLLRCYCEYKGQEDFIGYGVVTSNMEVYFLSENVDVTNGNCTFEHMAKGETLILEQQ